MRIPEHATLIRRMLDSRLKKLRPTRPLLGATLRVIAKHCGRPSCHCLRGGPKHLGNYLSFKVKGKSRSVYVPVDLVKEVQSWIEEHRRHKRLLQEIQQLTLALIRSHVQTRQRRQGRPSKWLRN
jgi:hypothetical protein